MKKILVIEDNESIRYNIVEVLEIGNFRAIPAKNGKIGLELAQKFRPDLVICDIMMPYLDGYEVLAALRNDPNTVTIPLIFLTAKDTKDDTRKGMNLGADDYLTKPFTPEELLRAVAARLEKYARYRQRYNEEYERLKGLQQRVKELEETSETTEDLLQKISQDLRDPLSNITLAIQMLRLAPSEEAKERYLSIMQQECEREIVILNQVINRFDGVESDQFKMLRRLQFLNLKNSEKNSRGLG